MVGWSLRFVLQTLARCWRGAGNVVDVGDVLYCFKIMVEGFEKGGLFVTWREP